MPKHGKKYRQAVEGVDLTQRRPVEEGVSLAVAKRYAAFDESVDVAICLGVNPKHSDQMVRGAVSLPNGLGKPIRVAVFCKPEKEAEAKEAGADIVGGEELVEQVKEGFLEFDKAVATPDMMAKVGQVGKVLGPRGLMPNAKTGTVTFDLEPVIKEMKAGRVEFRVDRAGVLHAPIGRSSFGADKLVENLRSLLNTVNRLKPATAKGTYFKSMAVATTMGPGFKIDPQSIRKFLER